MIANHFSLFVDNTFEVEERLLNKITLFNSPINIIDEKEIEELNLLFKYYSQKYDSLYKVILSYLEKKQLDTLSQQKFEDITEKYTKLKHNVERYTRDFEFKQKSLKKDPSSGSRKSQQLDETRSDVSEHETKKKLEMTKVFLNCIFTTTHIANLAKKRSLIEEKYYIAEILKLKFDSPKDQILIDFYNNNYKFCINHKFTLEKSSTFLSIMFFIFNYSVMNKKINKDKSAAIFHEIMDFHSLHRPPYSYEIFSQEEKVEIVEFVKMTFYHNFLMIENIFKYNMNIVLNSSDHRSIPGADLPKNEHLQDTFIVDEENLPPILHKYLYKTESGGESYREMEMQEKEMRNKSDIELYEEMEMEKLKTFVNSFYRPKNNDDEKKLIESLNQAKAQAEFEKKEAKTVLDEKKKEITRENEDRFSLRIKDVDEKVDNFIASIQHPPKK